ncbi:hypothetical protein A6A06_01505 [Streptomyces sp. CB02923]|uniref:hypothetical protein n=1 Tax=Streptomyces sp. CB02923 TaxID=1718985 RepID=UPI00093E4148|nr:hypothetical protein [Streptomyces sp. CB02923]OKI09410.1 hypothetical protein A6A06_01505 [Streptomyces sp. CB02923]
MPTPRTDLSAFATDLAARLPGAWTSTYHRHASYKDQFPTAEQLWDLGHIDHIVSQYVLTHDAVLHGPEDQRLYVSDRPLYSRQFVVAPLEPASDGIQPHHFAGVLEPNGIAVPNEPARAAFQVTRRVLPRYEQALHRVLRNAADEPEPPHRPAPPQVSQTLTLAYYSDGALGVPYESVPAEARLALYAHGFQYHPHQAAFLLPAAYGEDGRALRVQAVAQKLAAQGIGVNLRATPQGATAPPTTTARPSVPSPAGVPVTARHR